MLTAQKEQKGNALVVKLEGAVDDKADLLNVIGPMPAFPQELHVNCAKINRINSVGVKAWIKYFRQAQAKNTPLYFIECSPPIVQQINSVLDFTAGGRVVSLQITFACEACDHLFLVPAGVDAVKKAGFRMPNLKCPKCGGVAVFDDIPDLYFKFLMGPR